MTETPPSPITSAGPYYQGWVSFMLWARRATIAIIALLAVMAITLI